MSTTQDVEVVQEIVRLSSDAKINRYEVYKSFESQPTLKNKQTFGGSSED